MKKLLTLAMILVAIAEAPAQTAWRMAPGKIATPWAEKLSPANVLPEYPRPQMVRNNWINLNGLWQYNIQPKAEDKTPARFAGTILVPFAVESALSGVGKTVGKDSVLWYQRMVTVPASARKGRVLLHFGAVDWQCTVFVNGTEVGSHEGGYDPFSFDITGVCFKGAPSQKKAFCILFR